MSKTKLIALSVLMTLALTPLAYAKTESFTLAFGIIKTFDKETRALLPENLTKEQKSTFKKIIKENKKEATARIKSLRRSEGPSPKRFSRLFRIIDRHIDNHIIEVEKLALPLEGADRTKIEDMSVKLRSLRDEFLTELKASSYSERKATEWNKPEPVIDRSPYEERPGDVRGLYDR